MNNSNRYSQVILALFALLLPLYSFGKHLIGGEISYKCLGNGDYEIELSVYRDCLSDGANFDNEVTFAIYQCDGTIDCRDLKQGNQGFDFKVPLTERILLNPPDPTCALPQICVEQGIYRFRISEFGFFLPPTQNSYHIVYQRCCRSETVSNLISPEELGNTYTIAITPEAQGLCNNSPLFEGFPPVITCVNSPFSFLHSALDIDGDSLVYAFSAPLAGGGNDVNTDTYQTCSGAIPTPACPPPYDKVTFIAPLYSAEQPFGKATNGIQISTTTGLIEGVPTLIGQFVVGISVSEYRAGKLLSVTQREFQVNVLDCQEENERIGTSCDDGNPNTENDRIQQDCKCSGTLSEIVAKEIDLYFSEYLEGSNNNKCLEIFNPLDEAVKLSDHYAIKLFNADNKEGIVLKNLSGTIEAKGTYIVCYDSSDNDLLDIAAATFDIEFDGNDALSLEKDGALIDLFGNLSCFPNTNWLYSPTGVGTRNKTLLRCPCVETGVKLNPSGCGFPTLSTEWICLPDNDVSNLGIHYFGPSGIANIQFLTDFFCSCEVLCRERDSLSLVALYHATDGPNWTNIWDLNKPLDEWFGVRLDENGCVSCLDLDGIADCNASQQGSGNNLQGTLPIEIGNLENIQQIYLSHNLLTGRIPREMGKLLALQKLWLNDNQLIGEIPVFFILQTDIIEIALDQNLLKGSIPVELGNLASLELLHLNNNQLSACFPEVLKNLCSINYDFSSNPLLPWQGDFDHFCNGEMQITASCDDGNSGTENDSIQEDCSCIGAEMKRNIVGDTLLFAILPIDTTIELNSRICIKVAVENFEDILAMQYSMNWDSKILAYEGVQAINLNSLEQSNFSNTTPDELGTAWADFSLIGLTVPNKTVLYEVCFNAIQAGTTSIHFSNNPIPVEIVKKTTRLDTLKSQSANITVGSPTLDTVAFSILPKDTSTEVGNTICLKLVVENFTDILSFRYSLNWDSALLHYDNIQNFGATGIPSVNFSNADKGVLKFSWSDLSNEGTTLEDGSLLYEICFTALRPGTATLAFLNDPVPIIMGIRGQKPMLIGPVATITIGAPVTTNCNSTTNLGSLTASKSIITCDDTAMLNASLPDGFTGKWTANASSIVLESPDIANTLVSNLPQGTTTFTWSVDTVNCATYMPTTVSLLRLGLPKLTKDDITISDQDRRLFDVLANDNLTPDAPYTLELIQTLNQGDLENLGNGRFAYTAPENYTGTLAFNYEVCYQECRTLCDQTTVQLSIMAEELIKDLVEVPNAITPNGDGLNDQFIIQQLIDAPEKYTNSELLIFNRWGDEVYHAQPYDNTWSGTNQSGAALPEATYYYILRLNLQEGEIFKGELVILR